MDGSASTLGTGNNQVQDVLNRQRDASCCCRSYLVVTVSVCRLYVVKAINEDMKM